MGLKSGISEGGQEKKEGWPEGAINFVVLTQVTYRRWTVDGKRRRHCQKYLEKVKECYANK